MDRVFHGKALKLVLDNDEVGRKGMAKVAKMLHEVACSVEIVTGLKDSKKKAMLRTG